MNNASADTLVSKARRSPLTAQVTSTVLVLACLSVVMTLVFGTFATMRVDQTSLQKQRTFISRGVQDWMAAVVTQQQTVTVWDDSVQQAKTGNQAWMAENLGEWMYTYYGHDRVYVLDQSDAPVYAMQNGKTVAANAYLADSATIATGVRQMRELLAKGKTTSDKPVFDSLISLDGRPAVLAIQPLVPSSDRVVQVPGTEYLHVDLQFLDQGVIDGIAEKFLLSGARLLPQSTEPVTTANIPLLDQHGVNLGYLAWNPDRPGLALVRRAGPALLAGAFLAVGVLVFLLRRLRRASSELQQSQDDARYLAFHDTLTGLPNRALFEDRLKRALLSVGRAKRRIALLYIDLDRFKNVNDTLGHPAGDELVRQTAARLEQSVRDMDTVARLGGDEFAIILIDVKDARSAEDLCERLLHQISLPFDLMGNQAFVGASIGVALSPESGADPADLLRKADIALYEAKKNGRGRAEIFAGDMDDLLVHKRIIESDLRAALTSGNQIRMLYQPIFAADCRTILGSEALIRWDHPVHGALSPLHFVTIAEERGMIGMLGDWTLREAAKFVLTTRLPWVAVNVSPLQLRDEAFAEHVLAILAETGLEASRLQLEITENVLIEDTDATRLALRTLRDAGVRIALDDFGTGYSSINYLRRHAIDKLKIDKSFIRLLGTGAGANAIVKSLVDLARALNVQVTAEGVETAEQRDLLVRMGCNELQGFLLAHPLGANQARDLVAGLALPRAVSA